MPPFDESKIESLLRELQALQAPDHSILRAKNIVMHAVRNGQGSRPLLQKRSFINLLVPQLRFKPMITFSLIVALLLGGGGTVAAAQNDLPGDVLFPIKIVSEKIAEKFALTSKAKVMVEAKLAERRASEIISLKARVAASAKTEDESNKEPSPEMNRHIQKATERLEARIEKTKAIVEALKVKDTKGTINAAAVLEAKVVRMEAALKAEASLETGTELKEREADKEKQRKEYKEPSIDTEKIREESEKTLNVELDNNGAVEIELDMSDMERNDRSVNLLKRKAQ